MQGRRPAVGPVASPPPLSTVRVFDAAAYLDEAGREPASSTTAAAPALSRGAAAWADVRAEVQAFRAAQPVATPFPKDVRFDNKHRRVCFVSLDPTLVTKLPTLFYVDLDDVPAARTGPGQGSPTLAPGSPAAPVPTLAWRPLVDPAALVRSERLSHEEALLRERMRVGSSGVAHYMLDAGAELLLFSLGSTLYLAYTALEPPLRPVVVRGTRLDVKMSGGRRKLLAHVRQGDLWLYDLRTGRERQLTFSVSQSGRSCGVADYVTQEEFHRFTGYWWSPDGSGRILAVEVDETTVDTVGIPVQGAAPDATTAAAAAASADRTENHRYPRAGRANATSELVMVEMQIDTLWEVTEAPVVVKRLWGEFSLARRYPWFEYLPRLGWLPDGKSVWVQGLDRRHSRMAVVKLSVAEFMTEAEYGRRRHDPAFTALLTAPPLLEETSDVWINVTDVMQFLSTGDEDWALPPVGARADVFPPSPPEGPSSPTAAAGTSADNERDRVLAGAAREDSLMSVDVLEGQVSSSGPPSPVRVPGWRTRPVQFVFASERTGYRHLYVATWTPARGAPAASAVRAITAGPWVVLEQDVVVDRARQLVYFLGKRDTPLETHLYVASLAPDARSDQAQRLTAPGYSHAVVFDSRCESFVDTFSSVQEPPRSQLCRLDFASRGVFPEVYVAAAFAAPEVRPVDMPVPRFFSFVNDVGLTIHGCVYLPSSWVPGGPRYPTLLKIYGGPHSQLVTNDYKFPRLMQLFVAVRMGYVVVLIDGRGSANRGLAFESHLKYRMGTVELADQLQGLAYLERTLGCVDRARVGVSGWSYGGYLALMAFAQHGDVFKVAVGGAPVTAWELYDTGYTEKYMGLPAEQAAAYRAGSVLAHAASFPAEENRVLIVHGLRDENVHFHHTSRLVAELVRLGKPHQLQMYPNERHGLRHPTAIEHFETLLFHFLRNHL